MMMVVVCALGRLRRGRLRRARGLSLQILLQLRKCGLRCAQIARLQRLTQRGEVALNRIGGGSGGLLRAGNVASHQLLDRRVGLLSCRQIA